MRSSNRGSLSLLLDPTFLTSLSTNGRQQTLCAGQCYVSQLLRSELLSEARIWILILVSLWLSRLYVLQLMLTQGRGGSSLILKFLTCPTIDGITR